MRGILGEVQWLVTGSRPDLAAACSLMQQRVACSTVNDLIEVNKIVAMARDFFRMGDEGEAHITSSS